MKQYLRNHPIVTAVLLGLVITIIMTTISIMSGKHYYYRISSNGDKVTDVQIQQYSEDGTMLKLLEQTSVEHQEDYTTVYFDVIKPGAGFLSVTYTCYTPQGIKVEYLESSRLVVSGAKNIILGEGIYNQNGISMAHLGIILYSLFMIFFFIWRRRYLCKKDRYSYAYMSTWSSQLFFSGIFLVYAITALISIWWLNYIDMYMMSAVTRYLMLFMTAVSFPLVLIFAISMTISNISLIRHEGKRFNNMLGIVAGIGLMGFVFGVAVLFVLFVAYGRDNMFISIFYSIVNAFYIVFFSALGGAIISGLLAGHHKPALGKDYIIILGCAIREDGSLYPLIQGRVDRAIKFWKRQELETGKKAVFVPSGGKGEDEIISEGEAMKRYLLEQGIGEEYILAETNSTTTYENMKFSKELIESVNPSSAIAFSTTNYHVMRSGIHARKVGLHAEGMGAPTKWYFWPNALLREVVGMFAYQPKMQILTMLLLALLAGAAGYAYSLIL